MPKPTFINLKADKKQKLEKILLTEFSENSLLDANINHIVKTAGIARGSFYTYFSDLNDAYRYTLSQVLEEVHGHLDGSDPYQATIDFLEAVETNRYYDFLSNYYVINQAILEADHPRIAPLDPVTVAADYSAWLGQVAIHQLMRRYFLNPSEKSAIITILVSLRVWQKEVE
ncbi:TetR/AcrR family transcriptional regulator [Fructobacillus ficulneus]|uniref:HTH tetR-type domain-containing protein n=1 Tax=Fructobacillus ficulneus TaxID=157463 RepID=A0A0K8MH39_9LACO|nr:TetR/AcrR family transcriptional regulator [Fructobacillus ficulneus]GAO99478.1 hypothetical protein FFIC_140720 [Fructobacillus ficulneus]